MTNFIKFILAFADELQDIWNTKAERTGVILYQFDGFALAVVTIGRCKIGDTISSTAWRLEAAHKFWGCLRGPIDWLFLKITGETNHCHSAYIKFLTITGALKQ